MDDGDILICGSCSTKCLTLKEFIEHKTFCSVASSSSSLMNPNSAESPPQYSISTAQPISLVLPSNQASIKQETEPTKLEAEERHSEMSSSLSNTNENISSYSSKNFSSHSESRSVTLTNKKNCIQDEPIVINISGGKTDVINDFDKSSVQYNNDAISEQQKSCFIFPTHQVTNNDISKHVKINVLPKLRGMEHVLDGTVRENLLSVVETTNKVQPIQNVTQIVLLGQVNDNIKHVDVSNNSLTTQVNILSSKDDSGQKKVYVHPADFLNMSKIPISVPDRVHTVNSTDIHQIAHANVNMSNSQNLPQPAFLTNQNSSIDQSVCISIRDSDKAVDPVSSDIQIIRVHPTSTIPTRPTIVKTHCNIHHLEPSVLSTFEFDPKTNVNSEDVSGKTIGSVTLPSVQKPLASSEIVGVRLQEESVANILATPISCVPSVQHLLPGTVLGRAHKSLEFRNSSKSVTSTEASKTQLLGHSKQIGVTKANSKSKIISCSFSNCSYYTWVKKDMVRHVRTHTGEKPFECSLCPAKFSRKDKLKAHQNVHNSNRDRPFPCTFPGCAYRASEKGHLRKHLRTHSDQRPFQCQFCPYQTRERSHLTVHLRFHTGDTPFHCQAEGCKAAFKTSSDYKRHLRAHSGEKPHLCPHCEYRTSLKSNLSVHIKATHPLEIEENLGESSLTVKGQLKIQDQVIPLDSGPLHVSGSSQLSWNPDTRPQKPSQSNPEFAISKILGQCFGKPLKVSSTTQSSNLTRLACSEDKQNPCPISLVSVQMPQNSIHGSNFVSGLPFAAKNRPLGHRNLRDKGSSRLENPKISNKHLKSKASRASKKSLGAKGSRRFWISKTPQNFFCPICRHGFVRQDSYKAHLRHHENIKAKSQEEVCQEECVDQPKDKDLTGILYKNDQLDSNEFKNQEKYVNTQNQYSCNDSNNHDSKHLEYKIHNSDDP